MKGLVVIPTYDEVENVRPLIAAILDLDLDLEVLIVDDASPDGTGAVVDELAREHSEIHVIHREGKLGIGSAHTTGLMYGLERGYDYLMGMDADFSHDPKYIPALVAGLADHDMMIGSRYVPGGGTENWGLHRQILSRTANIVARIMLSMQVRDLTAGFRCFRREVIETVDPRSVQSDGYSYQEEMNYYVHKAGFRIGETPIVFADRRAGQSKISRKEVYKAVLTLFRLRFGGTKR